MEKIPAIAVLAIHNYIDNALNYSESADVYETLRKDFGMTDESITLLGYAWLIPDESNETEERPLLHFSFVHRRYFDTVIEVDAHDEQEAQNLAETEAENTSVYDMDCYVWETERITD